MIYPAVALLAIGVADFLWQRRNPLITFSPSVIVIKPGFLSRTHQLSYTEVAGWAQSTRLVGFETIQSKRIYLPLLQLKKPERIRLLKHLESLNLGQPGFVGFSQRNLERRERMIWGSVVIILPAVIIASLWFAFRNSTTSSDEYYASLPRCTKSQLDTDSITRCFSIPQVREYLESAKQKTLSAWRLPPGISAGQSVTLTFRIGPGGIVECLSLPTDLQGALARSIISAVHRAAPFAPLPSEAICLAQVPITATFSNPEIAQ
jgi:hypothetical protein